MDLDSSSGKLRETLLQLRESHQDNAVLTQQLHKREEEAQHLEKALGQARKELSEKESQIVRARHQAEMTKKASEVSAYVQQYEMFPPT